MFAYCVRHCGVVSRVCVLSLCLCWCGLAVVMHDFGFWCYLFLVFVLIGGCLGCVVYLVCYFAGDGFTVLGLVLVGCVLIWLLVL